MISRIKAFLEANIQSIEKAQEDSVESKHAVALAAAALMIEIAKVDQQIDENELDQIANTAKSLFHLNEDEIKDVISLAHEKSAESTSLYEFTNLIHEHLNESQKYQIILAMWRVAFADGNADHYEQHVIRKVAELIYVPHVQFMHAKHEAETS